MITLGQLSTLPESLARNPFYRLMVKFSRLKTGSAESLFTAERFLLRYSWLGLLVLFALVLPNLEEIDVVSTLVRLATLVYPAFFIWSLTRISAVELAQLVLEGHWTGEVLAAPITNQTLFMGFLAPIGLVFRQYLLITVFSLLLYGLETNVVVVDGFYYWSDLIHNTAFTVSLFCCAIGWITFIHLARLYTEVRLRSGLMKGLVTLSLFMAGLALLVLVSVFVYFNPETIMSTPVLLALTGLLLLLILVNIWFYIKLARHFRGYLRGHLDLDPLIYDETDPQATAWQELSREYARPQADVRTD